MTRARALPLAAVALLFATGCGDPDLWTRYQAERSFWRANRRLERIQLHPAVAGAAEYDRARAAFRAVMDAYPAGHWGTAERQRSPYGRDIAALSGRAALALARLDELRGRTDAALAGFARTQADYAEVRPVALEAALARGAILDRAGRRDEATAVYLGIAGRFPMVDPETGESILAVMDAPLRVAHDFARTGRSAAADSILRAAEKDFRAELEQHGVRPAAVDLWVRLARVRVADRRVPEALDALRRALVEPRANVADLLLMIATYSLEGGLPDTAFAYTAWVERDFAQAPRWQAQVLTARAWEMRGPPDSALAAWGRVLAEAPEGSESVGLARFRRGFIMESLDRWEQARTEYRGLVDDHPGHPLALDALRRIVGWHTSHREMEHARSEVRRALGDIDRMIAGQSDEQMEQRARETRAELLIAVEDWPPAAEALSDLWNRYRETPAGSNAAFRAAEMIETRLRDPERALDLYRDLADHAVLDDDRRRAQDQRERLERKPG